MFKDLFFCNNGKLSLIDLTTMGDSSKRGDSGKIGKFDSGLKYALVILYRHGVETTIVSNGVEYTFESIVQTDDETNKAKEVLQIIQKQGDNVIKIPTAFAIKMGHEWEPWMAVRELYANCIDEKGVVLNEAPLESYDTTIKLSGNDLLEGIINNWNSYFIGDDILPFCQSSGVSIYRNIEDHLKIYKNGILIHQDKNVSSKYSYDHPEASIDEMRVLNKLSETSNAIEYAICRSKNEEFIRDFIDVSEGKLDFERDLFVSSRLSETWVDIVNEMYVDSGAIDTYKNLLDNFMEDSRIDIGVKKLAKRAVNYYSDKIVVKTEERREEVIETFEEKIKKICADNGFTVTLPILISEISGMTCIADVYKKVIHVTEDFSEENLWEMVKAHFRILEKDPDAVFKGYVKLLK